MSGDERCLLKELLSEEIKSWKWFSAIKQANRWGAIFVQSLLREAHLTRGVIFLVADGFQLLSRTTNVTHRVTSFFSSPSPCNLSRIIIVLLI